MDQRQLKIDFQPSVCRKQNGSALIYVLFLIAFVSIVGTAMLTTVTYGQRNIVNNQEKQNQFYRAEGAIEIVLTLMEEYYHVIEVGEAEEPVIEEGAYFYIKNVMNPTKNYQYLIGEQLTETIGEVLYLDEEKARAKLYDPVNPNIYREIVAHNPNGGNGDDGGVPSPPSLEDPGFAYYDVNLNFTFDPDEDSKIAKTTLEGGRIDTSYRLIIPASVGEIVKRNDYPYRAEHGIYLGVDMQTARGNNSIQLETSQGDIVLSNGVSLNSSKGIVMTTPNGSIYANGSHMTSGSGNNGEITWVAGQNIYLENTSLTSSLNVSIISNKTVYADGAHISTGRGNKSKIEIKSDSDIHIQQAILEAFQEITLEGGNSLRTLFVFNASFSITRDSENLVVAEPLNININGVPASGCISNGVETICP